MHKVRPKVKSFLRARRFYTTQDMILQYKTHILPIIECHTGAIFHASTSTLARLDRIQSSFLKALNLTPEEAFERYNLAPLCLRRDIAILGLLHKCTLNIVHPSLRRLFWGRYRPAFTTMGRRHNKPLHTHIEDLRLQPGLYQRSIFNMSNIYNLLPQAFVDVSTIQAFQSKLTAVARDKCRNGRPNWDSFLSARAYDFERIRGNPAFRLV